MFTDSDDDSADYFSPEDDDYDDDEDFNGDVEEDYLDLDADNPKLRAVREGFSLQEANAPVNGNDSLFSTQPASQSSARKTSRRTSPRGKSPAGITSAIVGVIKGETTATEQLVIPKKKRFQKQEQQREFQKQQKAPENSTLPSSPPSTTAGQLEPQAQQKPMKKRKVSLSPPDSLAKRSRKCTSREQEETEVIDLLADDAKERSSQNAPDVEPQRLSPALLAAAKKQQQDHIAAIKQKRLKEIEQSQKQSLRETKNGAETTFNEQETAKAKRASKVAGVSLAESLSSKGASDTTHAASNVDITTSKTNKKRSKVHDDAVPISTEVKETAPSKTKTSTPVTKSKKNKKSATANDITKNNKAAADTVKTQRSLVTARERSVPEPVEQVAMTSKRKNFSENAVDSNVTATAKPPPKKKKRRITFEHDLLQKMFMSCRPYSLKELVHLMGKTTSEASVNFCLLSLTDKEWIIKKEFKSGTRTKELYWANQDSKDKSLWALDCLQLPDMATIREGRLELASLQQRQTSLTKEIEAVERTPSNEQLSILCETAQKEMVVLSAKLEAMKNRIASKSQAGGRKPPGGRKPGFGFRGIHQKPPSAGPNQTPLQLKKQINAMRDEWIKRKRKCMDFVDALADGMEKKVKDVVRKVLELETDEDENVKLPPKQVL